VLLKSPATTKAGSPDTRPRTHRPITPASVSTDSSAWRQNATFRGERGYIALNTTSAPPGNVTSTLRRAGKLNFTLSA
jgi:hypothetical protein